MRAFRVPHPKDLDLGFQRAQRVWSLMGFLAIEVVQPG